MSPATDRLPVRPVDGGWLIGPGAADAGPGDVPVVTRVRDLAWSAEALLAPGPGAVAALLVRLDGAHWYAVEVGEGRARAVARIGPVHQGLGEVAAGFRYRPGPGEAGTPPV